MIMPALSALFTYSAWKHGGNKIPAFGSVLDNHVLELVVLLLSPSALLTTLHLVLLLQAEVLQVRSTRFCWTLVTAVKGLAHVIPVV